MWEPRFWYHPVTSQSHGYKDVIVTYIRRSKIPLHIYSMHQYGKNQSTEVCGTLCIPAYEYNYKIITWCNIILQKYYITDRWKCENIKRYTNMNSTKCAHESKKENSRAEQGTWKDRTSDGLSMIHASTAHLWSATGRIHKLQAPRSKYADSGNQKLSNEWCDECQVACIIRHTCIDKS